MRNLQKQPKKPLPENKIFLDALENYALFHLEHGKWQKNKNKNSKLRNKINDVFYPVLREYGVLCDPLSDPTDAGNILDKYLSKYYERFGKIPPKDLIETFYQQAKEEAADEHN